MCDHPALSPASKLSLYLCRACGEVLDFDGFVRWLERRESRE